MVESVYWEWEFLIHTIKIGVKIAFIYDGFSIFRLIFPHKKFLMSIEDLFYWSYVTVIFFQFLQEQTDGVLRGYSVLGISFGMILYHKILGERMLDLAGKWIGVVKSRLTVFLKMITIKLCKQRIGSKRSRREHGEKKACEKK